jgi:hypothetical protein
MGAMREKDSADFDLDAFIDLFDEAITSDDPNVQKTLQHLMVIAALARNHNQHNHRNGPLRRLFEDLRDINNRLGHLETNLRGYQKGYGPVPTPYPGMPLNPVPVWTAPTTGTQWPPASGTYPPGTIFAQGVGGQFGSSGSTALTGAKSSTSYAWDPVDAKNIASKINSNATGSMLERVDDILRDGKYKGSSVGASDVKTA